MDFSFSHLNYNSIETLPGFEARAALTFHSAAVFRADVDTVPTIVDDTLSYVPYGGDNQMPFDFRTRLQLRSRSGQQKQYHEKKQKAGDRNIFKAYTSHGRYKGKLHKGLHTPSINRACRPCHPVRPYISPILINTIVV